MNSRSRKTTPLFMHFASHAIHQTVFLQQEFSRLLMAHLQHPNQPNVFKGSQRELYWRYRDVKHYSRLDKRILKKNRRLVHCCTSSTSSPSSSDRQAEFSARKLDFEGTYYEGLVKDNNWKVRRMFETEEEMKKVAKVQAEAFHEPVILFNDVFLEFFQAEVLSGLLYRLRNSPPDRYACLVAEPLTDTRDSQKDLVGVVDVTVQREESVLQYLPGAEEYLYVSGIAVLNKFRRQKVATTLLKACDILASIWGFEYLVLRAYEDDYGAIKLYSSAGYRVVSGDSPWMTTWIGRRRRILMTKQATLQ